MTAQCCNNIVVMWLNNTVENLVHAGQLNFVHAGQLNFVHAGQLILVHVYCWPAQPCSCWSAQHCSYWPAQRCSCWPAQPCSCWPAQPCWCLLTSRNHAVYFYVCNTIFCLLFFKVFTKCTDVRRSYHGKILSLYHSAFLQKYIFYNINIYILIIQSLKFS